MPLYVYDCSQCNIRLTKFLRLKDYKKTQHCTVCTLPLTRVITAPMIATDLPGYECPITGKWIEGRRQHEENLKRTDSRLLEPGETQEKEKARKAADEALDKAIDATVEHQVAAMPTRKREKLFQEVAAGADLTVTRK